MPKKKNLFGIPIKLDHSLKENEWRLESPEQDLEKWKIDWESFKMNDLSLPVGTITPLANMQIITHIRSQRRQAYEQGQLDLLGKRLKDEPVLRQIRHQAIKEFAERVTMKPKFLCDDGFNIEADNKTKGYNQAVEEFNQTLKRELGH